MIHLLKVIYSMKKYVVVPGFVVSKSDGQKHYIGIAQLIRLYGVPASECCPDHAPDGLSSEDKARLIYLRPQYDGNYSIKLEREHRSV